MDLQMFNLMGFGAPAVAGEAMLEAPALIPGEVPDQEAFVNLLDLASELDVGDFQSQGAEDWMSVAMAEISNNDARILENGKKGMMADLALLPLSKEGLENLNIDQDNMDGKDLSLAPESLVQASALSHGLAASQMAPSLNSMANTAINGKVDLSPKQLSVGQPGPLLASAETELLNDWRMMGFDAKARESAILNAKPELPSAGAVAQWGAAIASGDLKSVSVENEAKVILNNSSVMPTPQKVEAKTIRELVDEMPAEDTHVENALRPESKLSKDISEAADLAHKDAPKVQKAMAPASSEGFVAVRAKDLPHVEAQPSKETVEVKRKPVASNEAVSAREFMMNQELGMEDSASKLTAKTAPAVKAASDLGTHSDNRVSHQAVDFVADKIDQLRNNGGGVLRVHLDPKDLGSVMLKVSTRGGVAKVEIVAEKSETASMLSKSQGDLQAKLEGNGIQAQLNIEQGRSGSTAAQSVVSNILKSSTTLSSADLLRVDRSAPSEAMTSAGVRSTSTSSQSGSALQDSGSESWGRDERREFAREQWNSSRKDRRSA